MVHSILACFLFLSCSAALGANEPKLPLRPITDADTVLAVYREQGGIASKGASALVLAIWPDGTVIWSEDRLAGGAPYRTGTVDRKKVKALLADFDRDGFFADPTLSRPRYK